MKPPVRRHRIKLDLHADTVDDLIEALGEIQIRLVQHKAGDTLNGLCSGGCSSGFSLEHHEDPTMDSKRYEAALKLYNAREDAGRGKPITMDARSDS